MVTQNENKVLLIDDDPDCLDAVNQILQRAGYKTFTISDGRLASQIVTEHKINLVVVDYNMPEINGLQVINEIKKARQDIPVLLMTAEPSDELKIKSAKAGAFGFIPKPINIPIFKRIVSKAIQSDGMRHVTVRRSFVFTRVIQWIKHK
ncbi:response regulator [Candidatus Poribacteria bacterium]|nr:response regulator [Candidatus Poribacteria bacterium]